MLSRIFRKILRFLFKPFIRRELFEYSKLRTIISFDENCLSSEKTSNFIFNGLKSNAPMMISRFGYTELNTLYRYENIIKMNKIEKIYQWAQTSAYPFSENCILNNIHKLSGFYPVSEVTLKLFAKEMFESMKEINLLGSWVNGEDLYKKYLTKAKVCELQMLEPYLSPDPWSKALEGKKVLVIHPFSSLIRNQYENNRKNIFKNKDILPDFELKTLQTPITYPGSDSQSKTWFENLNKLTRDALKIDFDVALIGCGAYGMPLAARLKKEGKISIHLGGSLQILFGIRGKRWDKIESFRKMYNEFWVYPSSEKVYNNVEDGCYWK